jgi:GNAT superfamily N-acetyltransferase
MDDADLVIRPMRADEEDLARFKACFDRNGSLRELSRLRWQYLENPVGRLFVDFAVDPERDRVGAIYATFPVTVQIGGVRSVGVQSLDTLTDADYRGRGLFKRLARSVYERCRADGVAFVYGFPNKNSAHGFFNRLGWTRLDPVPFLFLPLRARYFLQRLKLPPVLTQMVPNFGVPVPAQVCLSSDEEIRVVTSFDDGFDSLWETFSAEIDVAVARDHEYLAWRLGRKPSEHYRTYGFYGGGRFRGFVTFTLKEKHGGRVGYIMELIHDPDHSRAGVALLSRAVRELKAEGADVLLAWALDHSPNRETFRRCRFLRLPEALRPIELHFGVHSLAAGTDVALWKRESWYLSYCDSDTV